jgi:phage tail-like protein
MVDAKREHDYVGNFNFKVEINGITTAAFKAIDGLGAELEVIEYQDGDDLLLRKRPGRLKINDVTFKRGFTLDEELLAWWQACREGKYDRKDITIYLMDNSNNVRATWVLYNTFIKNWKVNGFDGKGNDQVVEEITCVAEDLKRM